MLMRLFILLLALAAVVPAHSQVVELGTPPLPTSAVPKPEGPERRELYEPTQWIDITNREQVYWAYWKDFDYSTNVPIGWTGDHESGNAGDTSMEYKQAVIRRVNYFRGMAGVPAWIHLNLEFSGKAQQAALMMSVNKMLSHFPPPDWLHYTEEGAEAARNSNICVLFNSPPDPGCVTGYMADRGPFNGAVGHRRWILNPPTREMGTGDVPQAGQYWFGNSLWVFDAHLFDPRPETRDGFVAWPPPGFVPRDLVFDRWSFSYPNADFSGAAVAMERNGQALPVTLETLSEGFGENTIVWVPGTTGGNAASAEGDVTSKVTVSNVLIDGAPRTFEYDVTSFNAATPGFEAGGLVNSASFAPGAIAPDAWADLYGASLANGFILDSTFPTSIDGVRLTFTDSAGVERDARLHFVSRDRIQFVAPGGMAPGEASLKVTNSQGLASSGTVTIAALSPGIFSANASGRGPAAAIWRKIEGDSDTSDFTTTLDAPRMNIPIDLGSASAQVYLSFFGTGFRGQRSASCRIGGVDVPVIGAVAQGEFLGLDQVNVGPLPMSLAGRGEVTVEFVFDGIAANAVTISIQ
jgi:uncharacterized protein (TIGR03437 family)